MPKPRSLQALGIALAGATAALALTGCSGWEYQEDICAGGEYPVLQVSGTGSACEKSGDEPSQGYTRYPEGKVPKQVDDKWDVYWRTHTVDKKGNIIDAP
ncbi:hypothetical protein OHT76_24940 [Streptomyces sp. NBC_00287]|uniref:SCO0607 family lipoprotein n=1 Tax=Streptomyces sp. NBC_00287 TaxID=2975702 RepID=UPI002E2B34DE|nr:hypothetical protein [Streptomyces sp. NBC_00287]